MVNLKLRTNLRLRPRLTKKIICRKKEVTTAEFDVEKPTLHLPAPIVVPCFQLF